MTITKILQESGGLTKLRPQSKYWLVRLCTGVQTSWCHWAQLCYLISKSSNDHYKNPMGKRWFTQVKGPKLWYIGQLQHVPLSTAIGL